MGGTRRCPIAYAVGQQRDGLGRHQVRQAVSRRPMALSVGKHERQTPVRTLDHLQGVAAHAERVLGRLGNSNVDIHGCGVVGRQYASSQTWNVAPLSDY